MRFAVFLRFLLVIPFAVAVVAASLPQPLQGSALWEVGAKANGQGASRHCLADSAILAQWEHRQANCTRVVLTGTAERSEVQYTCPAGGFGNSKIQVLTPRSVRIQTQGISGGLPFGYTLYARRLGPCAPVKR